MLSHDHRLPETAGTAAIASTPMAAIVTVASESAAGSEPQPRIPTACSGLRVSPPVSPSYPPAHPLRIHTNLTTPPQHCDQQFGGHKKKDSKFDEDSAADDTALMLARAEVANDLLYRDPKRVVIEHGHLQADRSTLISLADVTSPSLRTALPVLPLSPPQQTTTTADDAAAQTMEEPHTAPPSHGGPRRRSSNDSYKVYPSDDERALPEFILNSKTMEELDAVTSAWEKALGSLPDGDFWQSVISDLDGLQKRAPLHLAAKVRAGIPAQLRGVVWQTLTKARSTYLQTVYTQLVKEHSPHERVIRRDLTRTFPRIPVFKREGGDGQQRLFRILKAYSLYDAEVGYCQGLGFIIGPLILSMGECEAFCVLVRLMETYDLRGMFTEDMAGLHLRLYQFQILVAEIIPDVMHHFEEHGVLPAMYVPAWFLSLFAYTMPLGFVLRAMDVVMAEGAPESIMRVGIALLRRNAAALLEQEDFESIMRVLNTGLYDEENSPRDRPGFILQEASQLSSIVTSARLEALEAQYCKESGVVLKGRPSTAVERPAIDVTAPNRTIMNFLGWPWGNNNSGQNSVSSSVASTPHPATAPAAAATPRWKLGGGSTGMSGSNGSNKSNLDTPDEHDSSGRISPRVLELTEAQKLHSLQLREQMLRELQKQENAPGTILGSISSLTLNSEVKPCESADSSTATGRTSTSEEDLAKMRASDKSDNAWRDQVLEPLQRQLHDARVTCDTHRDALVALQGDHSSLMTDLAMVKTERAEMAEQNEQLRMLIRKMDSERLKFQQEREDNAEKLQRAEMALIRARMELAEADEDRATLQRQLSNLRKFVSESIDAPLSPTNGNAAAHHRASLATENPRQQPQQQQQRPGRFSISNLTSNWGLRGSVSPRASLQHDLSTTSISSALSSSQQTDDASIHSNASSRVSVDKHFKRSSTIPIASLHRSKTQPQNHMPSHVADGLSDYSMAGGEMLAPRGTVQGSRQDALARLNGGGR